MIDSILSKYRGQDVPFLKPEELSAWLPEGYYETFSPILSSQLFELNPETSARVTLVSEVQEDSREYDPSMAYLASLSKFPTILDYFEQKVREKEDFVGMTIEETLALRKELKEFQNEYNQLDQRTISILEKLNNWAIENDLIPDESDKVENETSENEDPENEEKKEDPPKDPLQSPEGLLTYDDLAHLTLSVSSNNAFAIIKKELQDHYGDDFVPTMEEKYGFTPLGDGDYGLWVNSKANVGDLGKIAKDFHDHSKGLVPTVGKVEDLVDSGYNFAGSDLAKELVENGYMIREKFGFYDVVMHVSSLAEKYPPFMTYLSMFSIESPGGSIRTFVAVNMIRMPLPHGLVEDENGLVVPDFEGSDEYKGAYLEYVQAVFEYHKLQLRKTINSQLKGQFQ